MQDLKTLTVDKTNEHWNLIKFKWKWKKLTVIIKLLWIFRKLPTIFLPSMSNKRAKHCEGWERERKKSLRSWEQAIGKTATRHNTTHHLYHTTNNTNRLQLLRLFCRNSDNITELISVYLSACVAYAVCDINVIR